MPSWFKIYPVNLNNVFFFVTVFVPLPKFNNTSSRNYQKQLSSDRYFFSVCFVAFRNAFPWVTARPNSGAAKWPQSEPAALSDSFLLTYLAFGKATRPATPYK